MPELNNVINLANKIEEDVSKNDGKLSDENIKDISNMMDNIHAEEVKPQIPEVTDGHFEAALVEIDPVTGHRNILPEANKTIEELEHTSALLNDAIENGEIVDPDYVEFDNELLSKSFEKQYGKLGTVEEMVNFQKLLREYQKDKHIKVYDRLPSFIKGYITNELLGDAGIMSFNNTKGALEKAGKLALDQFILNAAMDSSVLDLEKDIDSLGEEFNDSMQKIGEDSVEEYINRFRNMAEILRNHDDNDKADEFDKLADTIDDANHLTSFKEAIMNNRIKVRKYELENPKKAYASFYTKYENSLWNIYDIAMVPVVLHGVFPKENIKKINWLSVALANHFQPLDSSKTSDHMYMYSLIMRIVWLRLGNNESEKNKEVINTIQEMLNHINVK